MSSSMLMLFLRPLPPPHASYLRSFARSISTTRPVRQEAVLHNGVHISQPTTPSPTSKSRKAQSVPEATPTTSPKPHAALEAAKASTFAPLPYHIHRTASQNLPVYQTAKRGGNLHETKIRKVDGDLPALREELRVALGMTDNKVQEVRINQLTRQIVVKGWKRSEITKFLEEKDF